MEQNYENNNPGVVDQPGELLNELEKRIDLLIEKRKELEIENFDYREKLLEVSGKLKEILTELKKLKSQRG